MCTVGPLIFSHVACHLLYHRNCHEVYRGTTPRQRISCYRVGLGGRSAVRGLRQPQNHCSVASSFTFSVRQQYIRIPEEEREAVELSYSKLPSPGWVKIKQGKYKGGIGYVFDSEQSNGFVVVLIPPWEFPYPMPQGSVVLLDRSRLPNNETVSDITCDEKVVGWIYRGERYYIGLLLKDFHRDRLELVTYPHADDIQQHLQSEWDKPFFKKSLVASSYALAMRLGSSQENFVQRSVWLCQQTMCLVP
jgi:hypothetical protein